MELLTTEGQGRPRNELQLTELPASMGLDDTFDNWIIMSGVTHGAGPFSLKRNIGGNKSDRRIERAARVICYTDY